MRWTVAAALSGAVSSGCFIQHNEITEFPPGLEPVSENRAPPPSGGGYPEEASILLDRGNRDGEGFIDLHMRGYVHQPIEVVWQAMQDPMVVADRRHTDSQTITYDVEDGYDLSFQIHYFRDEIVNVEWDENWRYGTNQGTFEEPEHALIRAQKVEGTSFIDFIDISMFAVRIDDEVTEIGMVENISALREEESVSRQYAQDVYDSVHARSHGAPLP